MGSTPSPGTNKIKRLAHNTLRMPSSLSFPPQFRPLGLWFLSQKRGRPPIRGNQIVADALPVLRLPNVTQSQPRPSQLTPVQSAGYGKWEVIDPGYMVAAPAKAKAGALREALDHYAREITLQKTTNTTRSQAMTRTDPTGTDAIFSSSRHLPVQAT